MGGITIGNPCPVQCELTVSVRSLLNFVERLMIYRLVKNYGFNRRISQRQAGCLRVITYLLEAIITMLC